TCDQDHSYTDEQKAFDHGLMDQFVQSVAGGGCTNKNIVMNYYDGNNVTAMWNYAQHLAMSDNSFNTTFGPSTPGALNLISGQTGGITGDPQPAGDKCDSRDTATAGGRNVGDLLNAKGLTWGWFQGGFADCNASHQIGQDTN